MVAIDPNPSRSFQLSNTSGLSDYLMTRSLTEASSVLSRTVWFGGPGLEAHFHLHREGQALRRPSRIVSRRVVPSRAFLHGSVGPDSEPWPGAGTWPRTAQAAARCRGTSTEQSSFFSQSPSRSRRSSSIPPRLLPPLASFASQRRPSARVASLPPPAPCRTTRPRPSPPRP